MDERGEEQGELVVGHRREVRRGLDRREPRARFGGAGADLREPAGEADRAKAHGGRARSTFEVEPEGLVAGRERRGAPLAESLPIYPRPSAFFDRCLAMARSTLRGWTRTPKVSTTRCAMAAASRLDTPWSCSWTKPITSSVSLWGP